MKKLLPLLIIFAICASCEKDVKFKGKYQDPKLVLNSVMQVDSIITAEFTHSKFLTKRNNIMSTYYLKANDEPHLFITVNGNYTEELTSENGHTYVSTYVIKEGDVVEFNGVAKGYNEIYAKSFPIVGAPIFEIEKYDIEDKTNGTYEDDTLHVPNIDLRIRVTDPTPNKTNMFLLSFSGEQIITPNDSTLHNRSGFDYSYTDPIFNNTSTTNPIIGSFLESPEHNYFSDLMFDGSSYVIKTDGSNFWYDAHPGRRTEFYLYTTLYHLDEAYYRFIDTKNNYAYYDGSLFTEPVQVYSNVENGFGIVGSKYKLTKTTKLIDVNN